MQQGLSSFCIIFIILYKRIIKAAKLDGDGQADQEQGGTESQGDEITPGEGAANVPGTFAAFAEAAQFHRVGDDVDTVEAR